MGYSSYPRYRFTLKHEFLRQDSQFSEQKRLLDFFNDRCGRALDFLYFDREDYAVPRTSFGVGDGVSRVFRLARQIGTGLQREPVRATFGDTATWVGGAGQAPGDYTFSGDGLVTYRTPPPDGAVLEWAGYFMFRCRFDVDEWEFEQMNARHWVPRPVPFVTVKV